MINHKEIDSRRLSSIASDIANELGGDPTPDEKRAMEYAIGKFYKEYILKDAEPEPQVEKDKELKEMLEKKEQKHLELARKNSNSECTSLKETVEKDKELPDVCVMCYLRKEDKCQGNHQGCPKFPEDTPSLEERDGHVAGCGTTCDVGPPRSLRQKKEEYSEDA